MSLRQQFRLHYGEGTGKKAEEAFNLFRLGYEFGQKVIREKTINLIKAAETVKEERDGCLTKNVLITCKSIDVLCEAVTAIRKL